MLTVDHPRVKHIFRPISPIRKTQSIKMNNTNISNDVLEHAVVPDQFEHIFIVFGPAGSGKTTVAEYLAKKLSAPYVEGDDVSRLTGISFHH